MVLVFFADAEAYVIFEVWSVVAETVEDGQEVAESLSRAVGATEDHAFVFKDATIEGLFLEFSHVPVVVLFKTLLHSIVYITVVTKFVLLSEVSVFLEV